MNPPHPPTTVSGRELYALLPTVYRARDEDGHLAGYLDALGALLDRLRATLEQRLADAFATVVRDLSDGDGVVPLTAQLPMDAAWRFAGTLVDAAHHRLPEHPDAVAQVLADHALISRR